MPKEIVKIEMKNFLGWQDMTIPVSKPVLLIAGENAVGKSSIKDAVEYAFTGKVFSRGVTQAKDAGSLIHDGNGRLKVSISYIDTETGELCEKTRVPSDGLTGADKNPLLPYCINPMSFINLKPHGRAAILADVCEASEQIIQAAISRHIGVWPGKIKANLNGINTDMNNVDAIAKGVIAYRQGIKRDLKDISESPPMLKSFDLPEDFDIEKARQLTGGIEKKIQGTKKKLPSELRADLQKKIDQLDTDMKDCLKRIAPLTALPKDITPPYLDMLEKALAFDETIISFWDTTPNKKKMDCPVCGNSTGIEDIIKAMNEFGAVHKKYIYEIKDYRQKVSANEQTKAQMNRLAKEIIALKAKLTKIPKVDPPGDEPMEVLIGKLNTVQQQIMSYGLFMTACDNYQTEQELAVDIKGLIESCNSIAKALEDGGPVKADIQEAGGSLPVNKALMELWKIADIDIQTNGEIVVNGIPAEMLSDSEKFRVSSVLALALAEVGGVGFAVLDGFEILQTKYRNQLMAILSNNSDENRGIRTIIVIVTTEKKMDVKADFLQIINL